MSTDQNELKVIAEVRDGARIDLETTPPTETEVWTDVVPETPSCGNEEPRSDPTKPDDEDDIGSIFSFSPLGLSNCFESFDGGDILGVSDVLGAENRPESEDEDEFYDALGVADVLGTESRQESEDEDEFATPESLLLEAPQEDELRREEETTVVTDNRVEPDISVNVRSTTIAAESPGSGGSSLVVDRWLHYTRSELASESHSRLKRCLIRFN
ncbi:hypothetical protein L596_016451 [Steinernema carpocapsae]|nr:hypothetical protein L596_016451 [Steinernema carpocapsae]